MPFNILELRKKWEYHLGNTKNDVLNQDLSNISNSIKRTVHIDFF